MSVIHAAHLDGIVCGTKGWVRKSVVWDSATCRRCLRLRKELERLVAQRAAEERREATYTEACDALGVRHIWDQLKTETPTDRVTRGVFGAVILALREEQQATA